MNIAIENSKPAARLEADRVTTSKSNSQVRKTVNGEAFALDISGKVKDNTAYGGHGKTTEDVMQDAGQTDAATQKNYMAVMSNSMSDEDFAKLQKDGYHPGSMDVETVVTIVDEIKAALVKGGNHIEGYTDDLDAETLTQITGSAGLANEIIKQFKKYDIPVTRENAENVVKAFQIAAQTGELSEGVVTYMVSNEEEPTLYNIYRAQHSGANDAGKQGKGYYQDDNGYLAKKAEEYDWQKLRPQMEKIIDSAGLAVNDETISDAKWLIEKGIPLTEETISSVNEIKNARIPRSEEEIAEKAAMAAVDGKTAENASLFENKTVIERAYEYAETVNFLENETVDKVLAQGRKLNLRNLRAAQSQISLNIKAAATAITAADGSNAGKLQLEQIRLKMTVEVNIRLIKSGFSIDTAELSELVEALEQAAKERENLLYGTNLTEEIPSQDRLYKDTLSKVRELPFMPAALVGKFAVKADISVKTSNAEFTIDAVHKEGMVLRSSYELAGESYESLMTAPRGDLGDSIKKAFRNIDDILKEMNVSVTDENRRAARILGYNRMEISEENIVAVKSADTTIRRTTDKMTPSSVMQMIREGINPLSMNMEELETYLDNQKKSPEQDFEKYSEYLHKLEKNSKVSSEERETFIGIYRLFRQLEKTDGAAIGTLVNQGIVPTMENLLSAMRSNKKQGMDVAVDATFGSVTSTRKNKSISEQIETSYYKKLAADVFDKLDGAKISNEMTNPEWNLEQLSEFLTEEKADEKAEKSYFKQQAEQMRKAGMSEESVIKELLSFKQPVTVNNLIAAGLMMKSWGKLPERMNELASETGKEKALREDVENLYENLGEEKTAGDAYEKLQKTYSDVLEEVLYGEEFKNKINIKEISNLHKQISLAGNMARERNYEIPMNFNGEMTSVNLKIIHNGKENGKVTVSMQTENFGKVEAQFMLSYKNELSGYIVYDKTETFKFFQARKEELINGLEQADIRITDLSFIYGKETVNAKESRTAEKQGNGPEISSKKLYETAKIFIGYIRKGEGINYENML